jgi:hypothetical protein
MFPVKHLLIFSLAIASFAGCSTPPVNLHGSATETRRLTSSMKGQRVAISGTYEDKYDWCGTVRQNQRFEVGVAAWAPNRVDVAARKAGDVYMQYKWTCVDADSATKTGGTAALALLTLGVAPVVYQPIMRLEVNISRSGKWIFRDKYEFAQDVTKSLWAGNEGSFMKKYFDESSTLLMERFTKAIERDGALE